MAGAIQRLTLSTACLATQPRVVLDVTNVMQALPKRSTGMSFGDRDNHDSLYARGLVSNLEAEINDYVHEQGYELKYVVREVMFKYSIDYDDESMQAESTLLAAQGLLEMASSPSKKAVRDSPTEPQQRPLPLSDDVKFIPINKNVSMSDTVQDHELDDEAQNNSTQGKECTKPHQRVHKRLRPEEPASKNPRESAGIRFCWNIGWWLGTDRTYRYLEGLAGGLLDLTQTERGLSPVERMFVRENSRNTRDIRQAEARYRCVRARIIIGCACLHEHNIRGHKLNEMNLHHSALRTNGTRFKHLNLSAANVQLFCAGVDVNYSAKVFDICRTANRLPPEGHFSRHNEQFREDHRVNRYLPAPSRIIVYRELARWYSQKRLPPELCYYVSEEDLAPVPAALPSASSTEEDGWCLA